MNTNEKISNAMNIRSEKQVENVFIPFNKLHQASNEFYDEIEKLKKSIEHQRNTLVNWRVKDNLLQSETSYRDEMILDIEKLEMLTESYRRVLTKMLEEL